MRLVEIKDLNLKPSPIHYRRVFTGHAVFEMFDKKNIQKQIQFILEHSPFGDIEVDVELLEDCDYPLVPILRGLKQHITDLDKTGKLP